MSQCRKHELIASQHGFPKANPTVTDVIIYIDFIPPLFISQ